MQTIARSTWTGFASNVYKHLHSCPGPCAIKSLRYRSRHLSLPAKLRHMDIIPAQKRLRIASAAADTQADTAEVLSEASPDSHNSTQHSVQPADNPSSQSKPRKTKALPVPQLVVPGSVHDSAVWDCAVLLVDKPQTWTSFDVCGKLKRVLKVKKIGHAGTLDPMATGLLIICTGRGTKSIDSFQAMHKEYSGTMKLGEATDSYDADGQVTEELPWEHLTLEQLQEKARTTFVGDLQQMPPMFSALRVKGKRLYESAREGKVVERAARPVNVSRFELTQDEADPQRVHFYIACSKGTYIRSLAHDLAQAVGSAAHLVALRREAIGQYNVKDAWTLDQLQASFGKPKQAGQQQGQQQLQQQLQNVKQDEEVNTSAVETKATDVS